MENTLLRKVMIQELRELDEEAMNPGLLATAGSPWRWSLN
jgi:hypothetical protein